MKEVRFIGGVQRRQSDEQTPERSGDEPRQDLQEERGLYEAKGKESGDTLSMLC